MENEVLASIPETDKRAVPGELMPFGGYRETFVTAGNEHISLTRYLPDVLTGAAAQAVTEMRLAGSPEAAELFASTAQ